MQLIVQPCSRVTQTMGIWLTVLMAIDRIIWVKYPNIAITKFNLSTRKKYSVVLLFAAVLLNLPTFFDKQVCDLWDPDSCLSLQSSQNMLPSNSTNSTKTTSLPNISFFLIQSSYLHRNVSDMQYRTQNPQTTNDLLTYFTPEATQLKSVGAIKNLDTLNASDLIVENIATQSNATPALDANTSEIQEIGRKYYIMFKPAFFNHWYANLYLDGVYLIFLFLIPFVTISCINIQLIRAIRISHTNKYKCSHYKQPSHYSGQHISFKKFSKNERLANEFEKLTPNQANNCCKSYCKNSKQMRFIWRSQRNLSNDWSNECLKGDQMSVPNLKSRPLSDTYNNSNASLNAHKLLQLQNSPVCMNHNYIKQLQCNNSSGDTKGSSHYKNSSSDSSASKHKHYKMVFSYKNSPETINHDTNNASNGKNMTKNIMNNFFCPHHYNKSCSTSSHKHNTAAILIPYKGGPRIVSYHIPMKLSGTELNASVVLVYVILVFFICETPEFVIRTLSLCERNIDSMKGYLNTKHYVVIGLISEAFLVLKSSLNFFIFALFGRRFRTILSRLWSFRRKK